MNGIQEQLKGELTSSEVIENIFNALENNLMDGKRADLDFKNVTFINVHFLERLEKLVQKAKELNIEVKIKNVVPSIYKVFHVARDKDILSVVS
jgi:anti-anti-sigma regulatory factor